MADSYIQLPADSTGKKLDTENLTVSAQSVHRERIQIAGATDTAIAPVSAADGLTVNLGTNNDVVLGSEAGEGAALPSTFVVVAGDDGTDTHPLQVNATGDLKVTLDSESVTIVDGGGAITVDNGGTFAVQVDAALPAGSNNIGDVDVLTLPGTAAEAAALPSVFVVVAGDDGTDTHPLQMNAAGDLKVTLDSETVDVSDRAARDLGKVDIAAFDVALPAGSNNIGDVDIASALPAGTNKIGVISEDISSPYDGTTALTPKYAEIDAASSGNNTVISAVVGKKIRVLAITLVASGGANTVEWQDGASGTPLSGGMSFAENGGYTAQCPYGLFEGSTNTLLNLSLSAATSVDGHITYVEVA